MKTSLTESFLNRTALILGTGFGLGYCPVAPGTFGSLLGPPLVWGWQQLDLPYGVGIFAAVILALVGIPICSRAAKAFGREDPGQVVFDEIAAFPVVFFAVPVDVMSGVAGFIWFRVFDITKPWPVKRFEKLPGGVGVMADDLVAGVYAGVALWLTIWLLDLYVPGLGGTP